MTTRWTARLMLVGSLLLGCGSADEEPEPPAPPPVEVPGTCGTELRARTLERLEGVHAVGAYTADVALPSVPVMRSQPYEDAWTRVTRAGDAWQVDGEPVADLASALDEPRPQVMFSVPADLPATVLAAAAAPLMERGAVRVNVVESRFATGPYLAPDAIHAELRTLSTDCEPLRALLGADSLTLRSGIADSAFEGVNDCCSRIDAGRMQALMDALHRPHRWVPLPSGDATGKTVQAWIEAPPGPREQAHSCNAWAGRGPSSCESADVPAP